jgi:hypothetical protein
MEFYAKIFRAHIVVCCSGCLLYCRQAEFLQVEAPLSPAKVAQYDAAAALWQNLRSKLEAALQLAGIDKRDVWKTYWAAQQRFFKLLCVGLKLDTVIAEVRK